MIKLFNKIRQYFCNHNDNEYYYYYPKSKYINTASFGKKKSRLVLRFNVYRVDKCSKCNKTIRKIKVATNITQYQCISKYFK